MRRLSCSALLAILVGVSLAQSQTDPLEHDKTGIRWTAGFESALAEAKKIKRMILLVTIAGGTNAKGDW